MTSYARPERVQLQDAYAHTCGAGQEVQNAFQHTARAVLCGNSWLSPCRVSLGPQMWEVFTGHSVYEGVPADKLPYHVVKRGLRPAFPPETPSVYRWGLGTYSTTGCPRTTCSRHRIRSTGVCKMLTNLKTEPGHVVCL